ncbi:C4-dicarboxylate ABC transporter permease [Cereibacter changlensis JA139]|uniref:TRAP transporter small permease protein n=2 Tax=Cereibacter changlensis TaxID=402884 RepID=A0A2T4JZL3_9RHOB|nr:TRAP transporter small permease [Cereibacter changlensis]PTE23361.1 C4-dicarboxylate ABC transporter permease [Cereibacter changlensis JA139]PZX48586.1 TRAP-type C4-dicarboxylate transport system permease small subunit [Cereibacter changlensis]
MTFVTLLGAIRRRAENIAALMLLVMFVAFLLQIVARYLLNFPLGWTYELSAVLWIWLVLFGACFAVRDNEEMRFDLIYGAVGPRLRRAMGFVTALAVVALFGLSLPATWDYVTFMKVQKSAYLGIRFDALFSIYVLFAVVMIIRHLWIGWRAVFGGGPDAFDPVKASSGV